jgi:O-antigen ligase
MSAIWGDMRRDFADAPLLLAMAGLCLALPFLLYAHSLADIAISLIGLMFLARGVLTKDFAWARQTWVRIALVFWVYAVVRGLLSNHIEVSAGHALVWVRFIIFAAAVQMLALRSPALLKLLLWAFVAASVFGAADTLFQFAVGHDVFGRPMLGDRLTGPLGSPAIGNLLLFAGLPLLALLFTWLRAPSLRRKAVAAGGVLFLAAAIFLTGERMSVIFLGAALLLCLLFVARASWRVNIILVGAGLMAAALIYAAFPEILARHLSSIAVFTVPRGDMYVLIWQAAADVFAANPAFGTGMRSFRLECALYASAAVMDACLTLHPHNLWLELLAETGVVGTAILLAFFVAVLTPAVRLWRVWPTEPLLAGAAISVLLRLWPVASSRSFFSNQNEVLWWTIVAVAVAASSAYMHRTPATRA